MVARLSHRSVTHSRDVNGNGGLLNHTGLVRAIGSLDQQNRHLVFYTLLQRCNYRSGILVDLVRATGRELASSTEQKRRRRQGRWADCPKMITPAPGC